MEEFRPEQMLVLILGAHQFPKCPQFPTCQAFQNSAFHFKEYLLDKKGLAIPDANIRWLFDDCRAQSEQLADVGNFIRRRTKELDREFSDLLVYYVGHGLFSGSTFCLAVGSTDVDLPGATSIRGDSLAEQIERSARFQRRFLILDCCFSAAVYKEFQSGPSQTAVKKLEEEFPKRGTAMLCSSSAEDPSRVPEGGDHTMFSDVLLKVLREGHVHWGTRFSFKELCDEIIVRGRGTYEDWVKPEVLSPYQREGDIANIALFPNPARGVQAESRKVDEQSELQMKQEKQKAEAERQAAEEAEQERLRREKAEAEQLAAVQRAEAERLAAQKAEAEREARQKAEAAERARIEEERQKRLAQEQAKKRAQEKAKQEEASRKKAEEEKRRRRGRARRKKLKVAEQPVSEEIHDPVEEFEEDELNDLEEELVHETPAQRITEEERRERAVQEVRERLAAREKEIAKKEALEEEERLNKRADAIINVAGYIVVVGWAIFTFFVMLRSAECTRDVLSFLECVKRWWYIHLLGIIALGVLVSRPKKT